MSRLRKRNTAVALVLLMMGCLGLVLIVRSMVPDDLGIEVRTAETAVPELCDVYIPNGMHPVDWFRSDGSTEVSFEQLGTIAMSLGVRGAVDADDSDAREIAEFIGKATSDGDPSSPVPGGMPERVRSALASFDAEVSRRCGSE